MKCYNHPALEAVGQCVDCQAGLCPECAKIYSDRVCSDCVIKRKNYLMKSIYMDFFSMIVGATIGIVLDYSLFYNPTSNTGSSTLLVSAIVGAFIYPSWTLLNRFLTIQFYETGNQLLLLFVKFIISTILSVILGPISLTLKIIALLRANKQKKIAMQIAENNKS